MSLYIWRFLCFIRCSNFVPRPLHGICQALDGNGQDAMPWHVMPFYAMMACRAMACHVMPCLGCHGMQYAMAYHAMPWVCAIRCHAVPYHAMPWQACHGDGVNPLWVYFNIGYRLLGTYSCMCILI